MNKLFYNSPKINSQEVELESSIAAGSTKVSFGGDNPTYQPEIEDWQDQTERSSGGFTL
ncbi:hypothetical protein GQF61_15900 [Sphingobacterium sp. DK4209]|uniref:hypothetical protein n=1 Tax=Sphingobacterium zhuxiongii TaxID=2662364 RepID=UPI0012950BC7|nr:MULTISPECIES: hypothetical protein [unclassified Sphingobacterium]MVZ67339.1 hypothetical protein [Sphingobacterium sp. DK4209]